MFIWSDGWVVIPEKVHSSTLVHELLFTILVTNQIEQEPNQVQ